MNILQVIPAFYPSTAYGGAPKVVYEISKRLANRGYNVLVYTTDAYEKNKRVVKNYDEIEGIKVRYFKNLSNYLAYNHKLFIPIGFSAEVKRELHKIDIIHMHDYRTLLNAIIYKYAAKHKIPYILQPHGATPRIAQKQKLKVIFDNIVGYSLLSNSSKIFALNRSEAKKILTMNVDESRIEIIPNGINLSQYSQLPEKGTFREKYGIIEDKIILYLGRLHISKGIDLLIQAFSYLIQETEGVKLVIVGSDDGYLEYLKKLAKTLNIESKVLFTGPVPEWDKLAAYVDADVFVTPSFYGFPLTFLEAMACGIPIVTTNYGDFIEGIHNEVGFVTHYNEESLKNAIHMILSKKGLKIKFRKNAKSKIKEFDWNTITKEIEKMYESVLEGI